MTGVGWGRQDWKREEGARAGMKCSAMKLSEPLTLSYRGAYLSQNGCSCRSPLAHKRWLKVENVALYI